jgi:uncharacterized RDD family membrane protein YckC
VSQLVTGEAVALDLRAAGLPSRVLAGLLDAVLQGLLLLGLGVLVGVAGVGSDAAASAVLVLVLVLVLLVYPVAFETALRGRTPGKAALGLRVVRDDGGPVAFRHALVRGVVGVVVERFGITFFVAAVTAMVLHPAGKRLGDLAAGTVVLRERVPATGGPVSTTPPQLVGWAAQLELSGLPDELALQARQFVARAPELTEAAREDLGGRLVAAVLARVSPPPPEGTPGHAVLATVLAERRRREEQRLQARAPVPPLTPPVTAPPAPPASESSRTPVAPPQPSPPPPDEPRSGGGFAPPG